MDNFQVSIQSEGQAHFELAMRIIMNGRKTIGYRVIENTLILYWTPSNKTILLPYELDLERTISFAWGWLITSRPLEPQPDHDGSNGHGFIVYNEGWGHVKSEYQAFAAIMPIWAMYGK